ncbi:MAG: tRNA pseudouridine(55) synthase TruB [Gaiellaceae bacterium]|jgi:tRNA pseudouridine55 synthase
MAIPRALEPSGLVLVDKPAGPSSFQLVRQLRAKTGARAGHTGTLDPFASGLLLVLLGAATRLARYLVGLDKRYLTEIDLRFSTSTGDREGEPGEKREPPGLAQLERGLAELRGEVELRIPAASAVKIGGERAYRLVRRGEAPEMPLRRSRVHKLRLLGYSDGIAELDLRVGSGTYVRAIAAALGGHCHSLRRLEIGPFSVAEADGERILPSAEALLFLPAIELSETEAAAVRAGRQLTREEQGTLRLLDRGRLVAVGCGRGGTVQAETVMPV